MKMTFQPKKRQRSKVHGFRKRMSTANGRKVLKSRRAKGRNRLSAFFSLLIRKRTMKNYHSLRNNREFQMVYNEGNSKANRYLVLYYRKNDLEYNRLGISVSKKVGNSVVRHRTTRLIRESYRLNQDNLKTGYDMVVIARQTAKGQNYHTIESAFLHLIDLHHLKKS